MISREFLWLSCIRSRPFESWGLWLRSLCASLLVVGVLFSFFAKFFPTVSQIVYFEAWSVLNVTRNEAPAGKSLSLYCFFNICPSAHIESKQEVWGVGQNEAPTGNCVRVCVLSCVTWRVCDVVRVTDQYRLSEYEIECGLDCESGCDPDSRSHLDKLHWTPSENPPH